MGLGDVVRALLSRGTPVERDPDEMVEVEEVSLGSSQLVVETLKGEGIEAHVVESFNPAIGAQDRAVIWVPRRQHADATAILDRLR